MAYSWFSDLISLHTLFVTNKKVLWFYFVSLWLNMLNQSKQWSDLFLKFSSMWFTSCAVCQECTLLWTPSFWICTPLNSKFIMFICRMTLNEYEKHYLFSWNVRKILDQSSVAEWLGRWANLGVIATTELLGGRGFETHSRHE